MIKHFIRALERLSTLEPGSSTRKSDFFGVVLSGKWRNDGACKILEDSCGENLPSERVPSDPAMVN